MADCENEISLIFCAVEYLFVEYSNKIGRGVSLKFILKKQWGRGVISRNVNMIVRKM